jgi:hypothetical protein
VVVAVATVLLEWLFVGGTCGEQPQLAAVVPRKQQTERSRLPRSKGEEGAWLLE